MTDAMPKCATPCRRAQRSGAFVHPMHDVLFFGDLP